MEIKKTKTEKRTEDEKTDEVAQAVTPEQELKNVYEKMTQKYGSCSVFKLPNGKRVFVHGPDEMTWDRYQAEAEKAMWAKSKGQPGKTIVDIQKEIVRICILDAKDHALIAGYDEVMKFPGSIQRIAAKIESLAGSDIDEDLSFLE